MVQFLEWEGLIGRGLTGDLEPFSKELEWTVITLMTLNELRSITVHYSSSKTDLNPPLNPYLLAPPNLETEPL